MELSSSWTGCLLADARPSPKRALRHIARSFHPVLILASLLLLLVQPDAKRTGPTNELGGIVKKLNVLAVTIAMLCVPVAFADDLGGVVENPNYVLGQKLDSGLGALGSNYTGAEYMSTLVLGEKLDSGLGELTQEEIDRVVAAAQSNRAASNSYRRFLAMRVPPSNEGE
jgi:hypothetical protein